MDVFNGGTDGMDGKYKEMLLSFRNQMEAMLKQADEAVESQHKAFQGNFDDLSKQYGKGYEDIKAQLIKANVELITSFAKNFEGLKGNLKENYDGIRGTAKNNVEKNLKIFKDNCDEMIKKIPMLPPKLYKDLVQTLESHQTKSSADWEKGYKELIQKLESNFQQAVKSYTLPIATNQVSAVLNQQATSASTTVKPSVGQPMKASAAKPALVPGPNPGPAPAKTGAKK